MVLHGGQVDTIGWVGASVPCVHLSGSDALLVSIHLDLNIGGKELDQGVDTLLFRQVFNASTHNIRVERLYIDVSGGAASERPHLGFVFESSSDLQKLVTQQQTNTGDECHKKLLNNTKHDESQRNHENIWLYLRVEKTVKQEDKEALEKKYI